MRISVVIAAYHGEKYIGEQLLSLARQTLPPDEVWIGDDSEDGATEAAVATARLGETSRMAIHYLRNTPRRGVLGNFVNLAGLATGDLIFFCDQDDVWLPGKIERLAGLMEELPSIQVAGCNSKVVDSALKPSGRFLYGHLPPGTVASIALSPDYAKLAWPRFTIFGHNLCMRRSFLPVLQRAPLDLAGVGHDIWLTQTAAMQGAMKFVDEPLTLYRVHGGNTSELTLNTLNESLLHRLGKVLRAHDDLQITMNNLEALRRFCQEETGLPAEVRACVERNWEYFRLRLRLRRFWRPFRFLGLTPRLFRGYFTIGNGWRACLRDQLL